MKQPPLQRPIEAWPTVGEEALGSYALFELRRVIRRSPSTAAEHSFLQLIAPDWVNVVAITTDGRLVLVEQYRHGTNRVTLEIPGGAVDAGESPAVAAARELEEETGFRAGQLHLLGEVHPNPAFLSNTCWTYLAVGCRRDGVLRPDPSEEISIHLVELERFTELIDDGAIEHALVIAAHDHLQRGRRRGAPWVGQIPGWEQRGGDSAQPRPAATDEPERMPEHDSGRHDDRSR
jgi:8-oxo-dGTP pyrophosphatase MutT (NUDIX family)